jgi:peptide/nickel transport system ATP-binding protein
VTSLAILRLLAPGAEISGSIRFDGASVLELPLEAKIGGDMRSLRGARIAMIFQEPMTALNPVMRIGDQIAEAVRAHHQVTKAEAWKRAIEGLREVALPEPERRARDYPHQLSGGMRQRVMIAMALVNRPQLLIADEPTTALDVTVQAQILELLAELRAKYKLAMLFISHDLAVVSGVADRVAIMYAGQIVESAPAKTIFQQPLHPYTQGLLRSVPTLRTPRDQKLAAIEGTVPPIMALPPGCAFEPRCGLRIDQCRTTPPQLLEVAPGHSLRCPVAAESLQRAPLRRQ